MKRSSIKINGKVQIVFRDSLGRFTSSSKKTKVKSSLKKTALRDSNGRFAVKSKKTAKK